MAIKRSAIVFSSPSTVAENEAALKTAWAKAGVTFAGQTLEGQEWTNNATKILADPWNHPKNKPGLGSPVVVLTSAACAASACSKVMPLGFNQLVSTNPGLFLG